MILEIQVLKNKLVLNSSSPELSQKILQLLKELGLEIDVVVHDVRCG